MSEEVDDFLHRKNSKDLLFHSRGILLKGNVNINFIQSTSIITDLLQKDDWKLDYYC